MKKEYKKTNKAFRMPNFNSSCPVKMEKKKKKKDFTPKHSSVSYVKL